MISRKIRRWCFGCEDEAVSFTMHGQNPDRICNGIDRNKRWAVYHSILDVHQTLGLNLCIGTLCNLACWDDCGILYSNPAISSLASLPCEDDMKASQGWRWQLFAALFVLWSVLVYQVLFPFLRRVKYHSSLGSNSHTEGILFLCLHTAHWCLKFWGRQM